MLNLMSCDLFKQSDWTIKSKGYYMTSPVLSSSTCGSFLCGEEAPSLSSALPVCDN